MIDEDSDRYDKKYIKLVLVGTIIDSQDKVESESLILSPDMFKINSILELILLSDYNLAKNMSISIIKSWSYRFGIRQVRKGSEHSIKHSIKIL